MFIIIPYTSIFTDIALTIIKRVFAVFNSVQDVVVGKQSEVMVLFCLASSLLMVNLGGQAVLIRWEHMSCHAPLPFFVSYPHSHQAGIGLGLIFSSYLMSH